MRPPNHAAHVVAVLLGGLLAVGPGPAALAGDLHDEAEALMTRYGGDLDELARWCDQQGLSEQADRTRAWLARRAPYRLYVTELPTEIGAGEPLDGASAGVAEWHRRWTKLRHDQADDLYDLARRAIVGHQSSLAFDLVMAALRENPDHDAIRRILGYTPYKGEWRTSYEVDRLRKGQVWHDRFGWLPRTYVARYEQGQRYHRGQWITEAEDARIHSHIRNGWKIETEHYLVLTNHSIEAGVRLSRKLEELYRVWKELFLRYYATHSQVADLFSGGARSARINLPRHNVVYFRDRDNYNQSLRPMFPNIGISLGVYVDGHRAAYFFAGDEQDERTVLHEATHQLFHESRAVAPDVGREDNCWIIEGIAMYMESLRSEDGCHVLGGFDDDRIHAARYRLIEDDFYVPLSELVGYGLEHLKNDPRVATLYSQAAGLTHFLIHYDDGRYRDALVEYLVAVYSSRADRSTLAALTGTPYAELDRQYREYIESSLGAR